MKSYYFRRAVAATLIAGQIFAASPVFATTSEKLALSKEIKRMKDKDTMREGILVANAQQQISKEQELQKKFEPLIEQVYQAGYKGLVRDDNFLNKDPKVGAERGDWLKTDGQDKLGDKYKKYYDEFTKTKNYLGLRLLYYYANLQYKIDNPKKGPMTKDFEQMANEDVKDATGRVKAQTPAQKQVMETVAVPKQEAKKPERKLNEAERAKEEFLKQPVVKSGRTEKDLVEEATKTAEAHALRLKEYLQNPYIDHSTEKPWTKYVGAKWVEEVERIYNTLSSQYSHYGELEEKKNERDKVNAGLQKKAVNEVFMKHFGAYWLDEEAQMKIGDEMAKGKKVTVANDLQSTLQLYITNGKTLLNIYADLTNALKTAAPGTEEALIKNAMQMSIGKLAGGKSPLAKVFKIYEAYPWQFDFATKNGMDTQSPTAMLELMQKIAADKEFVKFKTQMNTLLTNTPIAGKYDGGSVLIAFNGLPLETQYELMQFMKRNFGGAVVPDSERFAAFVVGLGNLSPKSSAYFLQKDGELVYKNFRVDDIDRIMTFIGSRTQARELAYDYDNLKGYVNSLENKFAFLLEWNVYRIRESRRERPKSVTISSPGGKELMDIFRASGSIDINTILTLFEKTNLQAMNYTMVGGQPARISEFINLYNNEDLKSARLVTNFFRAYEKVMGKIASINVNTPQGYITVPALGMDLYALEDSGPIIPGEWTFFGGNLGGSGAGTKNVSGTATQSTDFKETTTSKSETESWQVKGGVAGGGPGREAYAKVEGGMPGGSFSEQSKSTEQGGALSSETRTFENENAKLKIEQRTRNIPFADGQIIEQKLNYDWDKNTDLSKQTSLGPTVPGGIKTVEDAGILEEKKLLNFWLDHNAHGATSAARLKFDEQTLGEKDYRRKFEVEIMRRQPSGSFVNAGTLELTYDQAQQVYAFYRQVIEDGKGNGFTDGKSVQVGYSHLLLFNKDIFESKTTKGNFEGVEALTQLGKVGAGGVFENKLQGPQKGLGLASLEFEDPKFVGAVLYYQNPEFKNLLAQRRMLSENPQQTSGTTQLEEPQIGARPSATLEDLKRRAENGGAGEVIFVQSQKQYGSVFLSVTDIIRSGAVYKYVGDSLMAGGGLYGEFKEGGVYGGTAYVSNKKQTAFLLGSLIGQKQFGWGADFAAKFIGESWEAKAITIYDTDATSKNDQVFAGAEVSFKGDSKEIRLYYIAGAKVEELAQKVQHLAGVDALVGKYELEVTSAPEGDILGKGAVGKLTLWNIFEESDFKLSVTGLFGRLAKDEKPGIEGTLWTSGLGLTAQKGKFHLIALPISYQKEEGLGVNSYETAAFGRYYIYGGWIDAYGGLKVQTRDKEKIAKVQLTELEKRLNLDLGIPLVDPNRNAWLASVGFGGGWKYLLFDENAFNALFTWGENPEIAKKEFLLTATGTLYSGHIFQATAKVNMLTNFVGTTTTVENIPAIPVGRFKTPGATSRQTSTTGMGSEQVTWEFWLLYTYSVY